MLEDSNCVENAWEQESIVMRVALVQVLQSGNSIDHFHELGCDGEETEVHEDFGESLPVSV